MCGIAGFSLRPGAVIEPERIRAVLDAIAHRGPDGEGVRTFDGAVLLHRRLSIIDVAGGAQPITTGDGTAAIVANGEIYNFRDLQGELGRAGVSLATRSDSEVALHLALREGDRFADRLRGMYALAVHDTRNGETVLARDPFGIKPLYLAQTRHGIVYASEPQAVAASGWIERSVRASALGGFLRDQFVAGAATLWDGIDRVLPGETVVLKEGRIQRRFRRRPELRPPEPMDEATALARLDALIEEATALHLQSEVPYAAFLSGGIDSGTVVAAMARLVERPRTFTIGFADPSVADERAQAAAVAKVLGTRHCETTFDRDDFWRGLATMARAMDDPVADYACLPTLKLAERARQDVTVVLSGEGGDEVFAGYGRYRDGPLDRLRDLLRKGAAVPPWRRGLFVDNSAPEPPDPSLSRLQRRQHADITGWLPADLLTKLDRCLMAHQLEGRVPLLDDRLAAFGFALPDRLKLRGRTGKHLLRSWLQRRGLPGDPFARKRGFTVPVRAWLEDRRDRLAEWLLKTTAVNELPGRDAVRDMLRRPLDKAAGKAVFTVLCYALWHETHIRGTKAAQTLDEGKVR